MIARRTGADTRVGVDPRSYPNVGGDLRGRSASDGNPFASIFGTDGQVFAVENDMTARTVSKSDSVSDDARSVRTLARSMYLRLQDGGFSSVQVVDFASTLLGLVGEDFRQRGDQDTLRAG
jgi:hypothetical protein